MDQVVDEQLDADQKGYVPPQQKSVVEIMAADADDESLNRWVFSTSQVFSQMYRSSLLLICCECDLILQNVENAEQKTHTQK